MELQLSKWFDHIQTPNSIGKYPICPFAAAAIKNNKVSSKISEDHLKEKYRKKEF